MSSKIELVEQRLEKAKSQDRKDLIKHFENVLAKLKGEDNAPEVQEAEIKEPTVEVKEAEVVDEVKEPKPKSTKKKTSKKKASKK